MHFIKTFSSLSLLGCLAACFPPTQTAYSPAVVERPQPVHFFCGEVIAVQNATLEYGYDAGVGVTPFLNYPSAGLHFGGRGSDVGARISAGIIDFYVEGRVPNLPATEYTVELNNGTYPHDPYLPITERRAAIIVVQNQDPNNSGPPLVNPVAVRVVGRSARVMNDTAGVCPARSSPTGSPPSSVGNPPLGVGNPPSGAVSSHPELQATQPMPVPLAGWCCEYLGRRWELLHGPQDFNPYAYGSY
jgi:hypothetical protein